MEKIEQQLKDLTLKFEGITKRIEAIPEEIIMIKKRIKEKEGRAHSSSRRYRKNPGAEATSARQRRKGRADNSKNQGSMGKLRSYRRRDPWSERQGAGSPRRE